MKIHYCYFCSYNTHLKHNLRTHVTKQKKCSYLIKSLTINSLEDYYKYRDLHKNDPENHIFGKDYDNMPPPKYYDSDDNTTSDDEGNKKQKENQEYVDTVIDSYVNKKHSCEYCNKEFNRKDSLKRHYCSCKAKKKAEEEWLEQEKEKEIEEAKKKYNETMEQLKDKELQDQILLIKSLMEQHEEKIKKDMEEKFKEEKRLMEDKI